MVTSVTFYTPEEHFLETAAELPRLPIGTAIAAIAGRGAYRIAFPLPEDPADRTPKWAARRVTIFRRQLLERSEYLTHAQVESQRDQMLDALIRGVHQLVEQPRESLPHTPPGIASQNQPLLDASQSPVIDCHVHDDGETVPVKTDDKSWFV